MNTAANGNCADVSLSVPQRQACRKARGILRLRLPPQKLSCQSLCLQRFETVTFSGVQNGLFRHHPNPFSVFKRIDGETDRAYMARWNICFGMNRTPKEKLAALTLCPHKSLKFRVACDRLNECVNEIVKDYCSHFSSATHLMADGSVHRHLALSLKSEDSMEGLQRDLRDGRLHGIYWHELEPVESPEAWSSYMTGQIRRYDIRGVPARLIYFSYAFPKAITSRHTRNDEYGKQRRELLRWVAMDWHLQDEEAYWELPPKLIHRINHETTVRQRHL
jgi:hypothetical protein